MNVRRIFLIVITAAPIEIGLVAFTSLRIFG